MRNNDTEHDDGPPQGRGRVMWGFYCPDEQFRHRDTPIQLRADKHSAKVFNSYVENPVDKAILILKTPYEYNS